MKISLQNLQLLDTFLDSPKWGTLYPILMRSAERKIQ